MIFLAIVLGLLWIAAIALWLLDGRDATRMAVNVALADESPATERDDLRVVA